MAKKRKTDEQLREEFFDRETKAYDKRMKLAESATTNVAEETVEPVEVEEDSNDTEGTEETTEGE